MNKYLTEFIGAFFLMFAIVMSLDGGLQVWPFVIGSALVVMVYMGGHISGAHYNPAVTLAVYLRGRCPAKDVAPYMVSQVLGAFAAAAVAAFILLPFEKPPLRIVPPEIINVPRALLCEVLFSFALVLVVLNVATLKKTGGNSYYGLAIGFTVAVGAACVGRFSGGAFNPAVGVGSLLWASMKGASIGHIWLYIVGPFAGSLLGLLVFKVQNGPNPE